MGLPLFFLNFLRYKTPAIKYKLFPVTIQDTSNQKEKISYKK